VSTEPPPTRRSLPRTLLRYGLAAIMLFAGVSHLVITDRFLGQLPTWLPLRVPIVQISGVIEIGFGVALVVARRHRRQVGRGLAILFVVVFPANLYQAIAGTNAFGLDTPALRWGRLVFQPLLIVAALWSTEDDSLRVP
jgi:uncharacterized membrane protein